jgi:NADPH:quinone reductase-like Zn-dependent oxidoreductase
LKAVVVRSTGGVDALQLEEIDPPRAGDGEVLIEVRAAAVNPVDWKVRRGLVQRDLPVVPGEDVSGVVELSRADGFDPGDEVFGIAASGGYAEYASASANAIAMKPDGLSFEQAAALTVSGMTAWQALFDCGRLEPGQNVLVVGPYGGIGHLAMQFARGAGAHVTGFTRGDDADSVREMDLVLDTVGGAMTAALLPTVREGGTLVMTAYPAEPAPQCHRIWVRQLAMKASSAVLSRIGELVASGEVRVEIAELLPLSDVRRAHELSEAGHTRGKIVLQIGSQAGP